MKTLILLSFCIHFCLFSFCQTDLEKILGQKSSVPEKWISTISNPQSWNVTDWVFISDKSRKVFLQNPAWKTNQTKPLSYQFTTGNVSKFPSIVDSLSTLPAVYFADEKTFYIVHTILIGDKQLADNYPFRVYYLDSTKLVLEHLDPIHFDYATGKILSPEEVAKKMLQNQPGRYDVIDRPKRKGKGEEGLRIVELLSIKND